MAKASTRVLIIIPARSGSKGIAGKNLKVVGGITLVERAILCALGVNRNVDVVVSSDDSKVLALCQNYPSVIPLQRPEEIAGDRSQAREYIAHAIEHMQSVGQKYASIFVLQPTSPFRKPEHVENAIDVLHDQSLGLDSVVSVVQVPHNFIPDSLYQIEGDRLTRLSSCEEVYDRALKPNYFARNGAAIYGCRLDYFEATKSLLDNAPGFVQMTALESLDIDTEEDLELARAVSLYFTSCRIE